MRPATDRQKDTDARDHNTFRVVYDSREMQKNDAIGRGLLDVISAVIAPLSTRSPRHLIPRGVHAVPRPDGVGHGTRDSDQ